MIRRLRDRHPRLIAGVLLVTVLVVLWALTGLAA